MLYKSHLLSEDKEYSDEELPTGKKLEMKSASKERILGASGKDKDKKDEEK
jgi:hypothetical protein